MIPYILILIFLIVLILWQVYSQTESFEISTDTTKNGGEMMVSLNDLWGALGPFSVKRDREAETGSTTTGSTTTGSATTGSTTGTIPKNTTTTLAGATGLEKELCVTSSKDKDLTSQPDDADVQSAQFTKEIEDRMSKNIVTQIKDQLAAQYQLQGAIDDMSPYAPCDEGISTDGMDQGSEFQYAKPTLKPQPDMSQYIRKDSIPCAKCNLSA